MKPLTCEWVAKAEGDYATARRENRARRHPNFDAVCFHAQQCAEKYLKALLQENGLVIVRSHNLEALAKPLFATHPLLKESTPGLRTLSSFAVETRYPGKSADRQIAREAAVIASRVRKVVRRALNLKSVLTPTHDEK
jgi:HEPN domain-containing protein